MTFGQQNSESEAHSQMDFAIERGINFIDTAEMYSTPARAETYGISEELIGNWFQKTGKREELDGGAVVAGAELLGVDRRQDVDQTAQGAAAAADGNRNACHADDSCPGDRGGLRPGTQAIELLKREQIGDEIDCVAIGQLVVWHGRAGLDGRRGLQPGKQVLLV